MGEETVTERLSPRERAGVRTSTAYLLLVIANLSWSGNMIVGRAFAGWVPPLGLSMMRWIIALAVVLPFVAGEIADKRHVILRE
jgi:drug/metabolite transporter (DMT)-like permease